MTCAVFIEDNGRGIKKTEAKKQDKVEKKKVREISFVSLTFAVISWLYYLLPNTFFNNSEVRAKGSFRIFCSSCPTWKKIPVNAFSVT